MSARFLTACFVSAGLLLAGNSYRAAAQSAARETLVTKVYPVADLVIPLDENGNNFVVNLATNGNPSPAPLQPPASVEPQMVAQQFRPFTGTAVPQSCPRDCPVPAQTVIVQRKAPKTQEETLIKLVTNAIAPQSWDSNGGRGSIEFFPLGLAVVVRQTPDIQEQIEELLGALRRLQDVEVAIEVRFVTLSDSCSERIGVDFGIDAKPCNGKGGCASKADAAKDRTSPRYAFLNDRQVSQLMEAAQSDQRTSVMHAPKLTVFNGMQSTFSVTDTQNFVTGVQTLHGGPPLNQIVFVPYNKQVNSGFKLSILPAVSADRRYVTLSLNADQTSLGSDPVPLFPVTQYITPVFEGGAVGQPVPFTQYIQQPKLTSLSVHKSFCVPDGGTVLLSGWKSMNGPRPQEEKSTLAEILDTLCPPPPSQKEGEKVIVLVTPRVIVNQAKEAGLQNPFPTIAAPTSKEEVLRQFVIQEEEEVKDVPRTSGPLVQEPKDLPKPSEYLPQPSPFMPYGFVSNLANSKRGTNGKVVDILAKYQQACSDGRLTEAKELAKKALAIDPACFSQNLPKKGQEKNESR